ncbi:hypothetical protein APHAL10511_007425 [Amanita phalloides]|nr:hypothetical protein APHAL10511_007425 [Amanita phalloides]
MGSISASESAENVSVKTTQSDESEVTSKWTTSRRELWAYYLYYVGNNGLPGFNFGPSQFQNLLFLAGYDPAYPPFSTPCGTGGCVLPYLGKIRDINSIVLLTNGISFAIQAVVLLFIGAWADYGYWRLVILIQLLELVLTIVKTEYYNIFHGFGCCRVICMARRRGPVAMAHRHSFICPRTNLKEVKHSAQEASDGKKTEAEHEKFKSLSRNRISNISFTVSSAGEIIILAIMVGILMGLKVDGNVANNTKAFSVLIAFSGGVWLLCAIPWFLFEKRRPGLQLPPGTNLLTIGFWQVYVAMRECLKLKQTFLYLIFYFLMGDVLNTTVTVVATLQNSLVSYSTVQLTLLLVVGIAAQALGIYLFWVVQKYFKISTKAMLSFNVLWILILTIWGLIGVHTSKFGFKHVWEIWLFQAFYGLMVCPWYAYSQTMISEVSPQPQMFLFFALFSVIGKTSAFIGPFISSAIITGSGDNDNMPFAFLFGLGTCSTIFLWLLDPAKSRIECEEFVRAEGQHKAFETQEP